LLIVILQCELEYFFAVSGCRGQVIVETAEWIFLMLCFDNFFARTCSMVTGWTIRIYLCFV